MIAHINPNAFAYLLLACWPIIALWLLKKKDTSFSIPLIVLVPLLFLPAEAKLVWTPEYSKNTLPGIGILIAFLMFKNFKFSTKNKFVNMCIYFLFLSPFLTVFTNRDALSVGPVSISGLSFVDLVQYLYHNIMVVYLPFIAGYIFLSKDDEHKSFLKVYLSLGVCYCFLALWEARMSPQLHTQVFGYFPHDFLQQMRKDGFRPVVFLGHGLLVAFFILTCLIISLCFLKERFRLLKPVGPVGLVLFVGATLIACKSLGALIQAIVLGSAILFFSLHRAGMVLKALCLVALLYPILKSSSLIPTDMILEKIKDIDPARASSLSFRFTNEDLLLEKANERRLFGWGAWGRNLVFDFETGKSTPIPDGYWIIQLGKFGLMGFFATIGLLVWPVLKVNFNQVRSGPYFTFAIAAVITANCIEVLPNSYLFPVSFLLAGSLMGLVDKQSHTRLRRQNE